MRKFNRLITFMSGLMLVAMLLALVPLPVSADTVPPLVSTKNASDITTTGATLNGDLTDRGTATSVDVTFEWGINKNGPYTNETTPSQAMNTTGAFSFNVTGLDGGTTYYFRAKAVGDDTSYGKEKNFTTVTIVTTEAASDITANSATLNGNLDSLGAASTVEVSFQWGTATGSYSYNTTAQAMSTTGKFSSPLSGLDVDTTYYFRAKADGGVYGTSYGDEKHFTTTTTPSPSTLYVDDDHFATIQDAIDAASSGDTISVAAGTYIENVEVDKQQLTLTGDLSQPSNVVVDAGGSGSAIKLTVNGCVLQGFKVQNGEYGIYLDHSDNNTLTGNTANSNTEYGIYLDHSDNNTLTENTANSNSECGIYLDNSDSNTLTSNIANSNTKHGIYLDGTEGSHGNTLTGNTANQNGEYGIYVDKSSNNTLTGNTISGNNGYGVNLDGSNYSTLTQNHITSNNIGVKIEGSVDASTISINFNNIHGNTEYGVENSGSGTADATNNWWGANDGPSSGAGVIDPVTGEPADGSGDEVSANVHFDPWLGAGVEDSKTWTTASGDDTVDAKTEADTEVTKSGDGTPIITVAKYESNPGGTIPGGFTAADEYIDVHLDSTEDVGQIEIKNYYTATQVAGLVESSLTMRWWNGESWVQCSNSGLDTNDVNGYSGYVWAIITADTTPNLTDLSGAVFGIIGTSPPTEGEEGEAEDEAGGGGGGGALGYWVVIIDNLGKITEAKVSPSGELLESVRATDAEGQIALELDRGTKILCPGGKVPQRLEMKTIQILLPQDMVVLGQVYRLDAYLYEYSPNPSLFTISPPGKLALSYDLSELPLNSLAVFAAYYDTQKGWVEFPSADITEAGKLTTEISGPMIFTLMVKLGPPPSLAEPGFRPSNLVIEPGEANPRQEISISLIVTNIGGAAGTCTLELKVDGVVRSVKSVSLEPGESEVVSFSITEDMEGKHMVEIADLKGDFSIVLIPFPWWLLSTAAIPPVIIILERRRRWKQRVAWSTGLKTKDWLVK
ncbi:MAG: right-handed parallel beta-helix repeat-containing protein [Dehalococcoidia bacterium]|nr:right-handed parallel beta-helix repeat-containing protein [Dehalococcoidia bacterium]